MKSASFQALRYGTFKNQLSAAVFLMLATNSYITGANAQTTTDLVAVGAANWGSIPLASSNGNGSFTVTNSAVTDFPVWATSPGVKIVTGDFNGDGRTDLAAVGAANWGSIPVAFSNGNGSFTVTNSAVTDFPVWATSPGVQIVTGHFR